MVSRRREFISRIFPTSSRHFGTALLFLLAFPPSHGFLFYPSATDVSTSTWPKGDSSRISNKRRETGPSPSALKLHGMIPLPFAAESQLRLPTRLFAKLPKKAGTSSRSQQPAFSKAEKDALWNIVTAVDRYRAGKEGALHSNGRRMSPGPRAADSASQELVDALRSLTKAKTASYITQVGRRIEELDVSKNEPRYVQERVIKATALAGLLPLSLSLLDEYMASPPFVPPSFVAYIAVSESLRKAGRIQVLESMLRRIASSARSATPPIQVSEVSFNSYLAALCERGGRKGLFQAHNLLKDPEMCQDLYGVRPVTISFNTVLKAAAAAKNRTMVDDLWDEMKKYSAQVKNENVKPNIYTVNALLSAMPDDERLVFWDRVWGGSKRRKSGGSVDSISSLSPDSFTIGSVLVPLARVGRIDDAVDLLDNYVSSGEEESEVLYRFSAFLQSLCTAGMTGIARLLFDRYFVIANDSVGEDSPSQLLVARVRHINVLLEGYRLQYQETSSGAKRRKEKTSLEDVPDGTFSTNPREEGWELFRRLNKRQNGLAPDLYTIGSMMGLCAGPDEVTNLLGHVRPKEMNSATLRAAMTAYGRLSDAASACVVLEKFSSHLLTSNQREWDTLLTAISYEAKDRGEGSVMSFANCSASKLYVEPGPLAGVELDHTPLRELVDGRTYSVAAQAMVDAMLTSKRAGFRPTSQSYCMVASVLQRQSTGNGGETALSLFHNATRAGIPADGRFVNACLRCFGTDVKAAVDAWKNHLRPASLAYEQERSKVARSSVPKVRTANKNLVAGYHGLLYVCGRALRPDLALRIAYAMSKEGIVATELSLRCYQSGKREQFGEEGVREERRLIPRFDMVRQYENLLTVECMQYSSSDRRRTGERRVKIIM